MSTFSRLWIKLRDKAYRHAFVATQLKRGIPFQFRAMRKKLGLSQADLAELAGVTQGVISRAEDPDYGNLTFNTVLRIAKGMDCAFVGRLVPFTDLARWFDHLSESSVQVLTFAEEDRAFEGLGSRSRVGTGRGTLVTVHDVASYILSKGGRMTAMKLQKLLYYSQAWSLVWDDKPIFKARIEAWANGPVVPEVYREHRGDYMVGRSWPKGDSSSLTTDERETVDAVLRYYGGKTSQWLSNLTHEEDPWRDARKGMAPAERGNAVIALEAMREYYSVLAQNHQR